MRLDPSQFPDETAASFRERMVAPVIEHYTPEGTALSILDVGKEISDGSMKRELQRRLDQSGALKGVEILLPPDDAARHPDQRQSAVDRLPSSEMGLFDPANAVGVPPRVVYGQKTYETIVENLLNPMEQVAPADTNVIAPFNQDDWRIKSQGLAPATGLRFPQSEIHRGAAQALVTSTVSTLDPEQRGPVAESAMRYLDKNIFSKGETVNIDSFLDSMKGRNDLTTDEKIISRAFAIEKLMVSNLEQLREIDGLGLTMHMHINDPAIYPDVIKGGATDFIAIGIGRHPNGSLVRIHHYPEDGGLVMDAQVHSHLTPISSSILEGRFINEAYRFEEISAEDAMEGGAQSLFQVKYDRGQSVLENMHVYGKPVMISREIVEAGGVYQMPANDPADASQSIFHAVRTDGATTLFTFEGTPTDKGRSTVVEDGSVERIVRERTLDEKIDRASFLDFMEARLSKLRKQ